MNLPKQIKRKIQSLEYKNCNKQQHDGQQLNSVCLNGECCFQRLACCYCQQRQHKDHNLVPLKDYLSHIYKQKINLNPTTIRSNEPTLRINPSQNNSNTLQNSYKSQQNPTKQTNYLSYIYSIQQCKYNLLKQVSKLKNKFIEQIQILQNQIQKNTRLYAEKIYKMIKISYDNKMNLIERFENYLVGDNLNKIQSFIQQLVQHFQLPQNVQNDGMKNVMNVQTNQKQQKFPLQHKFTTIINSYYKKSSNLTKSLQKFDYTFIPKLSKIITFQNLLFNNYSSLYEWNPLQMGKNFQINNQNKNIIKVLSSSTNGQRFALMKTEIANSQKRKFTWALKISKLAGWIGIGLALKNVITKAQLKFNYTQPFHGSYLISGNGYSWSHSQPSNNSKSQSFAFTTGDILVMKYDPLEKQLTFKKNNLPSNIFKLNIEQFPNDQRLCPCVNMCSTNDQVQIVTVSQQISI